MIFFPTYFSFFRKYFFAKKEKSNRKSISICHPTLDQHLEHTHTQLVHVITTNYGNNNNNNGNDNKSQSYPNLSKMT